MAVAVANQELLTKSSFTKDESLFVETQRYSHDSAAFLVLMSDLVALLLSFSLSGSVVFLNTLLVSGNCVAANADICKTEQSVSSGDDNGPRVEMKKAPATVFQYESVGVAPYDDDDDDDDDDDGDDGNEGGGGAAGEGEGGDAEEEEDVGGEEGGDDEEAGGGEEGGEGEEAGEDEDEDDGDEPYEEDDEEDDDDEDENDEDEEPPKKRKK